MSVIRKQKLGTALSVILILLLLTASTVFGFLYFTSRNHEKSYYDKKCESFFLQNANLSRGQTVFIGDSITDLYPLDDHYSGLPLATYNRGISGDTVEGLLRRIDVSAIELKPEKLVIMIGTNNINGENTDGDILGSYEKLLDTVKEKLPDTELYCISIIPQSSDRGFSDEKIGIFTDQIKRLNRGIKSLCEERGGKYIDLFPLLADENDRLDKRYSDDGLHLNGEGFKVWTALLKPELAE